MLLHLVLFKYNPDVDDAARAGHVEALRRLATLPGVLELAAGPDVVRSTRSYDTGLLVRFANRAALEAYATHPAHMPAADLGRRLTMHIASADFEI